MVYLVLAAATLPTYGLKSVDQYIKRAFPDARKIQQDHMHKHHPAIQQVRGYNNFACVCMRACVLTSYIIKVVTLVYIILVCASKLRT